MSLMVCLEIFFAELRDSGFGRRGGRCTCLQPHAIQGWLVASGAGEMAVQIIGLLCGPLPLSELRSRYSSYPSPKPRWRKSYQKHIGVSSVEV